MTKVTEFDKIPPGFTTATLAVPTFAIRLPGTVAVSCVPLPKLVASDEPFHCTVEPLRNPEPLTVSVNVGPPAEAKFWLKPLIVGVTCVAENVSALDTAPPGL